MHDTGASSFLYPFLSEGEHDLEAVVDDVRRSILLKAEEVGALRRADADRQPRRPPERRQRAPDALRARRQAAGVRQRRLGHRRDGRRRGLPRRATGLAARRAIDLTEDASILTAIANDIGVEEIFQRQVIAYGRERRRRDRAVDERQLAEHHRGAGRGAASGTCSRSPSSATTADGSRDEALADHVVITRSQHIPRIQEAQASGYHVLRELVELAEPPRAMSSRAEPAATANRRRVRARVTGTVQGVGFRPYVFRLATELRAGRVHPQ